MLLSKVYYLITKISAIIDNNWLLTSAVVVASRDDGCGEGDSR